MLPPEKNTKRRGRGRPKLAREGPGQRRGAGPTAARLLAIRVLDRVEKVQAFADIALHAALSRSELSSEDRALATELVFGTRRWRGRLDFLLSHVLDRPLDRTEPLVASTLRMGAYQIVFCDRIPDSAAVDQSVHCIRALGSERAAGLINAALRRLAREHTKIPLPNPVRDPQGHLVHALSIPKWIAELWLQRFGPEAAAELAAVSNQTPPATVRANRLRNSADELLEELLPRFPEARRGLFSPDALILGKGATRDPAFLAGRMSPQDEASQLVVEFLDPQPGESILDTCAAPGTKTMAIAERLGDDGFILALDRHEGRLAQIARGARRLGITNFTTLQHDAMGTLRDLERPETAREGFDRVLVDAPCSGLGTLRRRPDARWRIQPSDLPKLRAVQRAILARAADALRPGGTLVYSTCTLVSGENEEVVEELLAERPDLQRAVPREKESPLHALLDESGDLRCLPHKHNTDGFYAARLERAP